jgi:hypothetical protein
VAGEKAYPGGEYVLVSRFRRSLKNVKQIATEDSIVGARSTKQIAPAPPNPRLRPNWRRRNGPFDDQPF